MISPLPPDTRSTVPAVDPVRQKAADARQGDRPGTAEAAPTGQDRVEISAAARAQAGAASAPSDADVETARVALRAASDLGPARLHELRERVRTGYYDQPAAVERLATSFAADLARIDRPSSDEGAARG